LSVARIYFSLYKRNLKLLANAIKIDIFRMIGKKHTSLSVKEFPLYPNGRNALIEHPFFIEKERKYFAQIYSSEGNFELATAKRSYLSCISEIIPGKIISSEYASKYEKGDVIPVSIPSPTSESATGRLDISINGNKTILQELKKNSFHFIKIPQKSTVNLSSNSQLIVGDRIKNRKLKSKNKRLIISLFVDGLASHTIEDKFETLMPCTSSYFSKGARFPNVISAGNWTLPACGSLHSGLYPINHGMNNPNNIMTLGEGYRTLGENFQNLGYTTFQICSNFRKSPAYGYMRGFDRTLYKSGMNCKETIFNTIEHLRAFSGSDNYVWMTLFDLHHFLGGAPDTSSQTLYSLDNFDFSEDKSKKSIFRGKDANKNRRYELEIKRIDFYLGILYDFITQNYEENEVVVSLCSDHGQRFLLENKWPLSEEKVKVPIFFRGGGIIKTVNTDLFSTTDYLPTLLNLADMDKRISTRLQMDGSAINLRRSSVPCVKRLAISESIFPGQTYKASLFSDNSTFYVESDEVLSGADLNRLFLKNLKFKVLKVSTKRGISKTSTASESEAQACIAALLNRKQK
jgi:hypothetical protein